MLRICSTILILSLLVSPLARAEEGSTVGARLELGFYSRIHNNIDATTNILRKKQLSSFATFAGYGSACRGKVAWLDLEPMNEGVLRDLTYGDLTALGQFMSKNKKLGTSDTTEFQRVATCLTETYRKMGDIAAASEKSMSSAGLIGLYTDGDTANSDYDIVSDIEKINSILFTQKLDYIGKANMSAESFVALARGEDVPSIFGDTSTVGASAAAVEGRADTPVPLTPNNNATLTSLGIGDVCSVSTGVTPVGNLTDGGFADDLGAVLAGGTPPLGGATYGGGSDGGGEGASPLATNKDDQYDQLPCDENFCIKVTMVPGQINLLGGGKSYSIESLLDKHAAIMNPIANSNLASTEHAKNSYAPISRNLKLSAILGGIKVYVEQRGPQEVKKIEKEDTQEEHDAQFEWMRRCAYVSAGLPSDIHRANITGGVGYQLKITTDTTNVTKTEKDLSVTNPEDYAMRSCMDIALGKARADYYAGFSTDLTELHVFTESLANILSKGIQEHTALDKKKIK